MNINIRKATMNDLSVIQDLNHELFMWDYPNDKALNTNWPYEKAGEYYFRDKINGVEGVCYVVESDGQVVGYVAGKVNKEIDKRDTLLRSELENIYIKPEFRGSGVGKKLTDHLISWSKELGAQNMTVSAYHNNEGAIGFYKECGFNLYAVTLEKTLS